MRIVAIGCALTLVVACGKGDGGGGGALPGGGGSGTAHVTYAPAARVLERDEGLKAIVGTSSDGWTLVFDTSNAKLKDLKAGDILIIKGLVARKVLAVEPMAPDQLAVLTRNATLGEAIKQGDVKFDAAIRFKAKHAALTVPNRSTPAPGFLDRAGSWLLGTAYAGVTDIDIGPSTLTVKGEYEGWDAQGTATLADGRVNLDLQASKSLAGFKALITGKGYVSDFDASADWSVANGVVDRMRLMSKHLNGRMDFTWEVGKDSPGGEYGKCQIKLPAIVEIPLYEFLDGLPLFLDIGAALLIEPAITAGKEITKGSFHVTFSGTSGVQLKGGKADGSESKSDGDGELDHLEAAAPAAPVGMVVAFAAPRFELTFGIAKVFKGTQIKQAAEVVDKVADKLITNVFGPDGLAKWKASLGGFSLSGATEAALKSDATAWLEVETSTGSTTSGAMAIVPCRKSEMHMAITAGFGAQMLGTQVANESTTLWKKDVSKIEPPNLKACQ